MTDPDRKPETPAPEDGPSPTRPASSTPDWVDSMTGSPGPTATPAPEPTPPAVAADAFAGSPPSPDAAPASDPLPASETFVVRPEGAAPTADTMGMPGTAAGPYAAPPPPAPNTGFSPAAGSTTETASKKVVAGILGILLGSLGIHKFYLGIQQPAIIMLCITLGCWLLTVVTLGFAGFVTIPVLTAMGIIGLVEGIIYLTKTDEQFRREYEIGKKPWF